MTTVVADGAGFVAIGKQGENRATQVCFPVVADWFQLFGEGVFQLLILRPTESTPYAVPVTVEGGNVCWVVTGTDVSIPGIGWCELRYMVGNTLAKSASYVTLTEKAIGGTEGPYPTPWEEWVDQVMRAAADAEAAQTASETAQGKAEDAQTAAETAQTAAETAQRAAEVAQTAAESAKTAADADAAAALEAKSSAQTSASSAASAASDADGSRLAAETAAASASGSASAASSSAAAAASSRTAAEYSKLAAENAQTAAESAKTAAERAQGVAAASEMAAGQSALDAETSRIAASAAESAAEAAAVSASGSASSASTSAAAAASSASAASSSAAAAETAQTAAESAQAAAETAQTAAETAAASLVLDTTLSESGKAADAKATGDIITAEEVKTNFVHDLVNYGYDTSANLNATASATDGREIGIVRNKTIVTLNGTCNNSAAVRIRLNGSVERATNVNTIRGWDTNLFTPETGKSFKFTVKLLSGTSDGATLSIYKTGSSTTVSTDGHSVSGGYEGTFTADGSGYNIALFLASGRSYTNAKYIVLIQEINEETILDGYEKLEYLESDGTQYLDTNKKLDQNSRVEIKFAITDLLPSSGSQYIFGARKTSTSKAFYVGRSTSGQSFIFGYNNTTYSLSPADTKVHNIDFNQNNVYFEGELVKSFDSSTFETPTTCSLFACRDTNTSYYGKVRIYSFRLYDNGTLVRDFIPVKRISDGVTGMINLISGTFFTASATLISGPLLSTENLFFELLDVQNDISDLQKAVFPTNSAYVSTEADRVAAKVRGVQTGKTLTFAAISDLHYAVAVGSNDGVTVAQSQAALGDMRDGIKAISSQTHIDFYACLGDIIYQWQGHGANYDNGAKEAIAVTKIISDAFGNNKQVRAIGNHDPNCENATKEFSAYMLNSFTGIYSDMLEKDELHAYGGYGLHDFDRQKIRLIVLNTSYYTPEDDITNSATRYYVSKDQADWLVNSLDLSDKDDAAEWQIMIFSHVVLDNSGQAKIYPYSDILAKYESGGSGSTTVDSKTTSYNFAGKNAAKLALYLCGHAHKYSWKNMRKIVSGNVDTVLKMANVYVPNALPGRDEVSMDGVTYTKTANSATSTAFQIITIDPVNMVVYAHHYGAGIDIVMHYNSQAITSATSLSTDLTSPEWNTNDANVATVLDGTVTPVESGNTMIWAKSETDNCVEVWNINVAE